MPVRRDSPPSAKAPPKTAKSTLATGGTKVANQVILDPTISLYAHRLFDVLSSLIPRGVQPTQGQLADLCPMSDRMVRSASTELEDRGLIRTEGTGRVGKRYFLTDQNTYRHVVPPSVVVVIGSSSLPQSKGPQEENGEQGSLFAEDAAPRSLALVRPGNVPRDVAGRQVKVEEWEKALAVLDVFNEVSGLKMTSKEWVSKIILRLREHPELEVEDHRGIIVRNFAAPWWNGLPSPSVIYGNSGIFERSMHETGVVEPKNRVERKKEAISRLQQERERR